MSDSAVFIRSANKSYDKHNNVLSDFSMTVPRGSIYGLLGASGCGKTTLLNCIVGRSNLDSGDLWVLGGKPGTIGSQVPGPSVGYMPQEVALFPEFSVKDSVYFFGKLMEMTEHEIKTNFEEFKQILDLPPDDRYLKDCSGGQQRRISFACALIHKPELLILDEPTAGVDPLLRDRIWNFLKEIAQKQKTTVIITTHYIEETRAADVIGLMRHGQLVAEAPPNTLLNTFCVDTLEDVFLFLSHKQEKQIAEATSKTSNESNKTSTISMETLSGSIGIGYDSQQELFSQNVASKPKSNSGTFRKKSAMTMNKNRMMALMNKNWKQFYRNISSWVFVLIALPLCCSLLFMMVIGADIRDLQLAVVNEDSSCEHHSFENSVMLTNESCHMEKLGCRYLKHLDNVALFNKVPEQNLDEAMEGIRLGKYIAVLHLPKNHSLGTEERFMLGHKASEESVEQSKLKIYIDMTNYASALVLSRKLIRLYREYVKTVLADCNYMDFLTTIYKIEEIYGNIENKLTVDMLPGYFLTVISYIATMLTAQIIISERLGGLWNRCAVAGVSALEIILTHFILQFCVMVAQVIEIYLVTFFLYEVDVAGSMWIILLMGVLQGTSGMVYGLIVSISSYDNYFTANILISGGFYPMILICGIFWPLQGQPKVLQWISMLSPFSIPAESFRYVVMKGWDLTNLQVLKGVGVSVVWICILTIASIALLKSKQ